MLADEPEILFETGRLGGDRTKMKFIGREEYLAKPIEIILRQDFM